MKKKLWIRKLSCGHERLTNIAYISGNYEKPKINDWCFCRVCMNNSKITEVSEFKDIPVLKQLDKLKKELDKHETN